MKKLLIILSVLFILSSCDKEESFDTNTFPQKWELVSLRGSISGATPLTGNDIPYKETYVLNADSTFVKTRIFNGATKTASGTFTIKKLGNEPHYVFKHSTLNDLIGSCISLELKEYLIIQSNSNMYNGEWQACDGPGLGYKRVK